MQYWPACEWNWPMLRIVAQPLHRLRVRFNTSCLSVSREYRANPSELLKNISG